MDELEDDQSKSLINICHVPGTEKESATVTDMNAVVTGKGGPKSLRFLCHNLGFLGTPCDNH